MSEASVAKSPARWNVPAIDGSSGNGYMTAGRLEALQKDAYQESWKKGHAEGVKAGEAAVLKRAERFDELLKALGSPFEQLDGTVENQLVELAITIVKQLFRREIRIEPGHVIGVVREALGLLPVASRSIQVHLHPEDASLVRDSLARSEGELAWTIVEDALISRGGCQITTDNSQIDATIESRLHAVVGAITGDERS